MTIGVPKERKAQEHRVGMFPCGVRALVQDGHTVVIERGAGSGCGISDDEFVNAGARLGSTAEAWDQALVVKVKEPLREEYQFLRPELTLFTYLHLAANKELTERLLASGCTAIAYESVETNERRLPLLAPMSEIAGRMATIKAAELLSKNHGGSGKLMGGVTGVKPCKVVVIGAGIAGAQAAEMAVGLGADVTVMDINSDVLRTVFYYLDGRIKTQHSTPERIREEVRDADVVISCVLIPNAAAPKLITRAMIESMRPGSVIIDVAIDQGGTTELSQPTTHEQPCIHTSNGVLLYCVANMPGAYPRTSAEALTNATLPYVRALAGQGWQAAMARDPALRRGLNCSGGVLYCRAVGESLGLPWREWGGV